MAIQQGFFLIADITGYTQYLSETELDHAQSILTNLLNLLIEHTRPPLVISRLAGDAVISYGLSNHFLQGQTFAESLEDTYVSFRRMVELMVRNTTCQCRACQNIGALDLKFFVHHGAFAVQKLDAHDELVGSDVNLLHRLLKNHVTETLGLRAYTLYTEPALRKLGLDPAGAGMTGLVEQYEHLPPVRVFVTDMHPVWERKRRQTQAAIAPSDILVRVDCDINLRPELVWDYLIQPDHYAVLTGAIRMAVEGRHGGRVGSGSSLQCYHGDGTMLPLTVVDWQPFERVVSRFDVPVPIKGAVGITELRLEATADGTRLAQIMAKTRGPLVGRMLGDIAFRRMRSKFEADMRRFKEHIEADWAALAANQPPRASISGERIRAAARESLSPA
ncbi:MAG TPA: DUF2652 domain-containing protein [Devosia sp.]|nr:DUF2652 domain-containing protein [Devosia sp.]